MKNDVKTVVKILHEEYTCCKQCAHHSSIEFDDVGFGADDEYCNKERRMMHSHLDFGNPPDSNKIDEMNGFPTWCPLKEKKQ
jgi:hypothetical protein